MKFPSTSHRAAGFTLIELVLSAGLMTLVLAATYACLSAGLTGKKLVEQRAEGVQSARVALSLMAADFRAAVPLAGKVEFLGMRRSQEGADSDNVDFSTRNYKPARANEADYCEASYFLARDTESNSHILMRRRDATPDPEPLDGGAREEIARGVRGLRFEYYDGIEWFDEWGDPEGKAKGMTDPPANSYGLPEAVRITIVFDPETEKGAGGEAEAKEPMTFQTVARIELAQMFNQQAASANSGGNATAAAPGAQEGLPQ